MVPLNAMQAIASPARGVAREGAGWGAELPRNLADQLTRFKPGGVDNAPHITASPPGFK
jgi:hypothetical protein